MPLAPAMVLEEEEVERGGGKEAAAVLCTAILCFQVS